jgi:hypothetical protein
VFLRRVQTLAPLVGSVLCIGLFVGAAQADSVRCGSRFVGEGDNTHRVRTVCGEPDFASRRYEIEEDLREVRLKCHAERKHKGRYERCRAQYIRTREIVIDEWTYDFGKLRLVHHLIFRQGRLVHVATDGYGEGDE